MVDSNKKVTMTVFEIYLKGILKQILDSYQLLDGLKDKPGDLEIIKKELSKINGLLKVVINKLESIDNNSDDFVALSSSVKSYLENYDFNREIETISKLYSDDPNRLKNIRYIILGALQHKKLMEKIESIIENS